MSYRDSHRQPRAKAISPRAERQRDDGSEKKRRGLATSLGRALDHGLQRSQRPDDWAGQCERQPHCYEDSRDYVHREAPNQDNAALVAAEPADKNGLEPVAEQWPPSLQADARLTHAPDDGFPERHVKDAALPAPAEASNGLGQRKSLGKLAGMSP